MSESMHPARSRATSHWYLPLLLGILFIALGVWVLVTPLESFLALAIFFAVTFLISGVLEIVYAISNRHSINKWGWSLAVGIVDLVIGIILVSTPALSMVVLPLYVGLGVLFRATLAVGWAFELKRREVPNWGWLLVIGILGLLFALIMLWNPLFGGLTIVIYTGLALISIGLFQVFLSLRLKKYRDLW